MITDSINAGTGVQALIIIVCILLVAAVCAAYTFLRRSKKTAVTAEIFDAVNYALLVVSCDWKRTIYTNSACEKLCSTDRDIISNPLAWLDSVVEKDRPVIEGIIKEQLKPGEQRKLPDFMVKISDGSIRWISAEIKLISGSEKCNSRVALVATDITEWKLKEENYSSIVKNIRDVFYRTDTEGNLVMVSPGIKILLGYEVDESIGKNLARELYADPSDRDNLLRILREKGWVTDYETVLVRKDGSMVSVSASSHFYFNCDGSVAGVEGIVRDITERKVAEGMFNMAFHHNPCPMAITSIETGEAFEVNRAWLQTMECSRDEVIGEKSDVASFYRSPDDRKRMLEILKSEGRVIGLEIDFLTKTGKPGTGLFSGEVIKVGGRDMLLSAMLDISEKRKTERALIESEERFRRIAENAPDMIYRMRLADAVYEYINPVVTEVTGYPPEDFYRNSGLFAGIIHPDYLEYFKAEWEKLVKGDMPPTYEYKIIARNGTEKWLFQRNVLLRDSEGRPHVIEGVVTDITDRKRSEEELRLKNAILAAEQDVSIDGILIVDQNGRILQMNRRFSEILRIPDEITGSEDDEVLIEHALNQVSDPDQFIERVRYLYQMVEERSRDELSFRDGRIIERYSSPVKSDKGEHIGRVWYFRDITERRIAEERIRNEQLFSRSLIDSLPGIFYLYSYPDLKLIRWNRNHEILLGYDHGELTGINMYRLYPDENSELMTKAVETVMQEGSNVIEALLLKKNGEVIPFLLTGIKFVKNDQQYLMGVGVDITESKRKDEQLRQAQKLETVGTLAGGLAHDFNNILSGISSTVSLIKHILEKDGNMNDRFSRYIDLIDRSGKRAVDLIQQLLTLSRRYEATKKPVSLKRAVNDVIQICNNTFDKSIQIKTGFTEEEPYVSGDLSQVEQVILNLCVNAAHAMTTMRPKGEKIGGLLSITVTSVIADNHFCISHPDAQQGRYWLISHSDSGVGIDQEIIGNIFDPFFSTKVKGEGTGLGLTMVYNIVHQHGGFIEVYSERGRGSTFNVYLPEMNQPGLADHDTDESAVIRGEGNILIVDDEDVVRFMAESILRECGYNVISAGSGVEGLELFRGRSDSIDAVLLDMAMPGMSGKDVYIEMKKIKHDVKVLLASGFRLDTRVDEALELGINDFIQKPYSISDLSRKIDGIIRLN